MTKFILITKKIFFLIIILLLFIDAANVVDLFSVSDVIHFEGDEPDSSDFYFANSTVPDSNVNFALSLISLPINKGNKSKDLIYDQDSPSVINELKKECDNNFTIGSPKIFIQQSTKQTKPLYIENCQLQI
jgi:hypothetical protein